MHTRAAPAVESSANAYGFTLSSNRAIPGLSTRPLKKSERADVSIIFGEAPAWAPRDAARGESVLHHRSLGSERHALRYSDGTCFHIDRGAATIWATWPEPLTLEDTATYLLGPVLGFYLRLSGRVCLHGSAALIGNRAVAFVGPAGSGKSTLAAALAAQGVPIVTEDVACLDEAGGAFTVRPGYPLIRLWPGSPGARGPLPKLTPNWEKGYLPLDGEAARFHAAPAPLAAIFLIEPRRTMAAAAEARELAGQAVLSQLIANTYGKRLVDRRMRAHEFEVLGRLARAVPVRALALNADGARLAEACDWIRLHAP